MKYPFLLKDIIMNRGVGRGDLYLHWEMKIVIEIYLL